MKAMRATPARAGGAAARRRTRRVARCAAAAGLVLSAVAAATAPSAQATPATKPAPTTTSVANYAEFRVDGARIRTGPSTDFGIAGLGYRSHRVTVHCSRITGPQSTWHKLTDHTTGVSGWAAETVLYVEGQLTLC